MSKLGPIQQSMAALFTPESEKARSSQKSSGEGAKVASFSQLKKGSKSGDSLGNPYSPGYEGPLSEEKKAQQESNESANQQNIATFKVAGSTQTKIRLQEGWDKLLIAQKKLCEKARNLFVSLDAPERYRKKTGGRIQEKSRGSIVDLDIEDLRQELEEKKKSDKDAA